MPKMEYLCGLKKHKVIKPIIEGRNEAILL